MFSLFCVWSPKQKSIFDRQQVLAIAQYLLFDALSRCEIGVQQIKAVQMLLAPNQFIIFLILKLALLIDSLLFKSISLLSGLTLTALLFPCAAEDRELPTVTIKIMEPKTHVRRAGSFRPDFVARIFDLDPRSL